MIGDIVLWLLAIVGGFTVICLAGVVVHAWLDPESESAVEAPKSPPPAQIVNLRTIPSPQDDQPERPSVLQKTTMSITTTKYVDPNAKLPKEIAS